MKDRWRNEYAMVISRNSGLSFSFRFQGLLGTFYYISTQKKDLDWNDMGDLLFSVRYKSVKGVSRKYTIRLLFPFPTFQQKQKKKKKKKQGHELKRTETFIFVVALKRAIWNSLTMGCFNFFLECFFGGVSLVCPCSLPSYLRGFWIYGRLAVYAVGLQNF